MAKWTAPPIWKDGECWIIGGGASLPKQFNIPEDVIQQVVNAKLPISAYAPYMEPLFERNVIGVNNAYMLGDWLDVLFFGDCGWYNVHRLAIVNMNLLKVSCCDRFQKANALCDGIKYLAQDKERLNGISYDPSCVSWNNNSGAAAISLAAHFGIRRIILLGFDMTLDSTNISHWFGYHKKGVVPPFKRHLRGFDAIAQDAKDRGIEILNASNISKIEQFPIVNALNLLKETA